MSVLTEIWTLEANLRLQVTSLFYIFKTLPKFFKWNENEKVSSMTKISLLLYFLLGYFSFFFLINHELFHSLHGSLTQEQSLRDQFNQTMDNFESRLRARDVDIQQAQRSYDEVVAKLKSVSQERNTLAKQLEESSKNRQREKDRADK